MKTAKIGSSMVLSFLALILVFFPTQAAPAAQATPTTKTCHLCGDDVSLNTPTPESDGIVHAVMFWKAGCSHCEYVRANTLPPLQAEYGSAFDLLQVEVSTSADIDLLYEMGDRLGVEHVGVPFLLIGDHVLVGSKQIPEELPGLIETYLRAGGIAPPVIPELDHFSSMSIPASSLVETLVPIYGAAPVTQPTPTPVQPAATQLLTPDKPARPGGFGLAIGILVLMVVALAFSLAAFFVNIRWPAWPWLDWVIPALTLVGMSVAGYLTYVEMQSVSAVCGPVGDCNAVQGSPYARLFGFLPVGVLGLMGCTAILAAWIAHRFIPRLKKLTAIGMFGMAFFGVAFSVYLTYLEIYIIRAVCLWCLSSALIMTLLILFSLPMAVRQFNAAE